MTEIIRDITYAPNSSAQKLDLYLPDLGKQPYRVILWLHPGGFTMGDKEMIRPFVSAILARGYAAVSVNYRLAGEASFPAQIQDAKAAVRWVGANAGKYHFDKRKIAAWGISAGSTLAALLGTSGGVKELEDLTMGNPVEFSQVNAVISWYGPMDFTTLSSQRLKPDQSPRPESEGSGESKFIGGNLSSNPEKFRSASPTTYINGKCPPFYIQHGKADPIVPYIQSVEFARKLEAAIGKAKVRLNLIENAVHIDPIHSSPENIKAALDFLDERL
jgi:acetyl esterase/lipase